MIDAHVGHGRRPGARRVRATGQGHRGAVDKRLAAAAGLDHASCECDVIVALERVGGEPRASFGRHLESALISARLAPSRTTSASAPLAQRELQRVDQDRFAGAGFPP